MEVNEQTTELGEAVASWPGKMERIAVVGCGYVGSCLAAVLTERGAHVRAIDTDGARIAAMRFGLCPIPEPGLADALADAAAADLIEYHTDVNVARSADVVIVTVGTPIGQSLRPLATDLARSLRPGQLVILKSTVAPGSAREFAATLEDESGLVCGYDFWLASSPERLAEGEAMAQLRELPVVVGGVNPASTEAAAEFWRAMGLEIELMPSSEAAELVKLASNWWIDANIAIANELAQYCSVHSVDVMEVIRATNALPKGMGHVNLLLPSVGVGGSCLTKDPWIAWSSARQHGVELRTVETARRVNDGMPRYTSDVIIQQLAAGGRNPSGATVAVLGLAFKSDTGDLRETPALPIVEALRGEGLTVRLCDPLADPAEVRRRFGEVPLAEWTDAVRGADCVAILAGHKMFADIDIAALARNAPGCMVFDGRAYYSRATINRIQSAGLRYCGIGR